MKKRNGAHFRILALALSMALLMAPAALADEKKDMGGWEADSAYNRLYNVAELDRIRVRVVKIVEVTPMKGMSPAVALIARERDSDEDIVIHICPVWFMKTSEVGLKKGDSVKIRGCWAEIDGKDVFLGAKIKKGDYFSLKVRLTKDGTPFWTMGPEQLAKERAAS